MRTIVLLALAAVCGGAPSSELHAQWPEPDSAAAARADTAKADTVGLSLGDALDRAFGLSEEVRLARSQVELAKTQVTSARSAALPQISGSLNYTRTFQSPYGGGGGFTIPDSMRFEPDSMASVAERLRYLENNAGNAGLEGIGGLFGNLPFGQEHTYIASVDATQLLYSGGRTGAALEIAHHFGDQAQFGYQEELSDIELNVRVAYYHASLAQDLESIAAAAVEQAQRFLDQERLRFQSGTSSELDVLRAEVSLANLRPQLVEARNASEIATLDLKRLVNVPVAQPVRLTTQLEAPAVDSAAGGAMTDARLEQRPAVRSAETQVSIKEQQVSIAKGAYLPSVDLSLHYGRQLWPSKALNWSGVDWRPDFTASLGVTVPIFSGFKRGADVELAKVELRQSQLQLAQLREAVQLEYERALGERERARSSIAARRRTVDQAQRVYDLTVLRYEKGLSTQLEASDARLALLQARTNLAQAISDYYVADAQMQKALGESSGSAR